MYAFIQSNLKMYIYKHKTMKYNSGFQTFMTTEPLGNSFCLLES